jgi:hypothetical protein
MTMDALTWFKSVLHRGLTTPDPLRADVATEMWPDVPLHLAAARLRPVAPAEEDVDEDWDAVIARAKTQAEAAKAPKLPPPLPRAAAPEMQPTPPPLAAPQQAPALWTAKLKAARIAGPQEVQAKLDAVWGGLKKQAGLRPAVAAARRPSIEDQITPPPLAKAEKRAGRVSSTLSALAGSRSAGRRSP